MVEGRCDPVFPRCWLEGQFLLENDTYIYKDEDLSQEYLYQKIMLVGSIISLSHLGGGIPSEEADKKFLRFLIDVQLLLETPTREGQKFAFGKFLNSFGCLIIIWFLMVCL